jgi:hypothetical protein
MCGPRCIRARPLRWSIPFRACKRLESALYLCLNSNGYYLSVITTRPAAGPGRAARILLSAWSERERALYSIDTDGRNLHRLPETLPCDRDFTFTPDEHVLICQSQTPAYPFDLVTLRAAGEKALSDPAFGLAIWGADSHQFVTATLVGADRDVSVYHADTTYSSITRTAILLFNDVPMRPSLMNWSPDGRYLLFRGPSQDSSSGEEFLLLPIATGVKIGRGCQATGVEVGCNDTE